MLGGVMLGMCGGVVGCVVVAVIGLGVWWECVCVCGRVFAWRCCGPICAVCG